MSLDMHMQVDRIHNLESKVLHTGTQLVNHTGRPALGHTLMQLLTTGSYEAGRWLQNLVGHGRWFACNHLLCCDRVEGSLLVYINAQGTVTTGSVCTANEYIRSYTTSCCAAQAHTV